MKICIVIITLLALLTGCMVGPKYKRPQLPIQSNWISGSHRGGSPSDDLMWWEVFQDETLNRMIEQAFTNNRELEISGIQVYEAYATLAISIGEFFPQFQQLQTSHSYTNLSKTVAAPSPITSFHNYLFNFLASWEIDLWGKFRHGIYASKADLCGSIYNYQDVLRSLVGNLAQIYMQIIGFNEKIRLLEKNVAIQEQTVKIVNTKYKLGQTSGLDLQQALSVLYTTRATLEAQILGKALAEHLMCTLLGFAPFELSECYVIGSTLPSAPQEPSTGIPCDLVRTRPDIRAVEQAAIAQAHIVGIAEAELLPAFSLSGFFGWETQRSNRLFQRNSITSSFAEGFAWNLLNYGRLVNNVNFHNTLLQERLVNYQNSVINACREVEDAIVSYQQNQWIVSNLESAVSATAHSLNLSRTQYEFGAIEFLNVLTAQNNLVQQEVSLVDAKVASINSFIALETSLGKGWQFKESVDYISPCTKDEIKSRFNWKFW